MEDNHEPEVTLESIDSALDHLIKSAEATDLAKAYGGTSVETTGHHDERGKTSGGLADKGDMGGLESMMIGKMEQTLIEAGYPAEAIAAFMRGDDEDDDEDDDDKGGDDDKGFGKSGASSDDDDPLGKSWESFAADPSIADAIDVSPYLEALVQRTCEQIDGLAKSINHGRARQDEVNKSMAVAVAGMGRLVKGLAEHARRLDERLGLVERVPNAPKGHTRVTPVAKSFGAYGTEGQGPGQGQPLTKSQVLSTLSYMNLEKGVRDIGGRQTSELIGFYEAGNQLAPQALNAVTRFLASNPGEAQAALTYR